MPEQGSSRALRRSSALPLPRTPSGWTPPRPPARAPRAVAPDLVGPALLVWAEQDEGCLVLLEAGPDGAPVVRWVNRTGAELLGCVPDDLVGETLDRLLRSPFGGRRDGDPLLLDPRATVHLSLLVARRDGVPVRMSLTGVPLTGRDVPAWVVRLVPEGDRQRAAHDLRSSQERFRALADRAPVGIFSSEAGLRLAYVNDSFTGVFAESPDRLVGTGWLDHVHREDRAALQDAAAAVLGGSPQEVALRVLRPDGEQRSVQARLAPVAGPRRDVGFVGTLEDVTDQHALRLSLAHQDAHDPLTGLLNRRRLLELVGEELRQGRSPVRPALLFLDLDDFKHVNDSLGHDAGDVVLLEVAARLREVVREDDVVARFGGDEFAVLCRGTEEAVATDIARRVLDALAVPLVVGGRTVQVSASLGVVAVGPGYVEAEDVLRDADAAMYQAKSAGKDCWALFDEQARRLAHERVELARELRRAVERGELAVVYQPVVRLAADGDVRLASVEALCRWPHPARGAVPPDVFIEIAERTGLIGALGLQVLRAACRQMVRWQDELGAAAPASVSVNVSARQMSQTDLPEIVAAVLAETGLAGAALCLELTETVVMQDTATATASFARLHAMGVRIALDDFGTGYSSLSVLRELPFDQLKIDRSLLPALSADTHDPVVAAAVALGRALGLVVVAEGVETAEQVTELRRLGCPLAQGFLFGRPMTPEQLAEWAQRPVPGR